MCHDFIKLNQAVHKIRAVLSHIEHSICAKLMLSCTFLIALKSCFGVIAAVHDIGDMLRGICPDANKSGRH